MGVLEGKAVVITGGASGIGRATALQCAAAGAHVIIADIQDGAGVIAAAPEHDICFQRTDVSVSAQVATLIQSVVARHGRLDVLVNAAGIGGGSAPTADYSEADFDRVIATNLKGVFLCMKHALAEMVRAGGGVIVNIASILGLVGMTQTPAYAAAKGGVVQLTKVAALDYAGHHIRVNCICPGIIDTPMLQGVPAAGRRRLVEQQPIGRLGRAEEVAAAVVFLASDASAFTTGAVVAVDGGFTAQ
ncbi:MAG TPA: SDR family NAD(P)-dependent oxidoreductase [Candidatus Margulisiibacteriota bacterium]|nr:SDR family NAD(P)-dependent oxidoreductase [Candidatus Margulisiibacteriota bacterium]